VAKQAGRSASDDKRAQIMSKLFPVETVYYNGVPFEVKPLRYGRVPEATDFIWDVFTRLGSQGVTKEYVSETLETLAGFLDECVSQPDFPEWKIADFPPGVVPAILDVFIEQTIQPGNWRSLAQRLEEKYGVTMMTSLDQGKPSPKSKR
jgi:hypothetical protein